MMTEPEQPFCENCGAILLKKIQIEDREWKEYYCASQICNPTVSYLPKKAHNKSVRTFESCIIYPSYYYEDLYSIYHAEKRRSRHTLIGYFFQSDLVTPKFLHPNMSEFSIDNKNKYFRIKSSEGSTYNLPFFKFELCEDFLIYANSYIPTNLREKAKQYPSRKCPSDLEEKKISDKQVDKIWGNTYSVQSFKDMTIKEVQDQTANLKEINHLNSERMAKQINNNDNRQTYDIDKLENRIKRNTELINDNAQTQKNQFAVEVSKIFDGDRDLRNRIEGINEDITLIERQIEYQETRINDFLGKIDIATEIFRKISFFVLCTLHMLLTTIGLKNILGELFTLSINNFVIPNFLIYQLFPFGELLLALFVYRKISNNRDRDDFRNGTICIILLQYIFLLILLSLSFQ